jgi:hypothetical protein
MSLEFSLKKNSQMDNLLDINKIEDRIKRKSKTSTRKSTKPRVCGKRRLGPCLDAMTYLCFYRKMRQTLLYLEWAGYGSCDEQAARRYLVEMEQLCHHSCEERKPGKSRINNDQVRRYDHLLYFHRKASPPFQPLYTPQTLTLPDEFYPRLEVQNSKLAKELGHLVQWDGTTISQITKPPIPKFFPYTHRVFEPRWRRPLNSRA